MSEADIAKAQQASPPEAADFGIWEENWTTWCAFTHLHDQWQYFVVPGMAKRRGGPPPSEIESTVRLMGVPRRQWSAMFEDLKMMIRAVLDVDADRAKA